LRLVAVDLRGAMLAAAVCGGVLVTALTELLGVVGGLTLGWLLIAWATALAAAGFLLARLRIFRQPRPPSERPSLPQSLDLAMVVWIAMAVALTGALANLIWGLFNPYAAAFFYVAAVIGVMAGLAGKSGAFQNVSPRWLSAIIGAVFFFSLTMFILAFVNATTDETGFTSFPSMADLLSSYAVVFVIAILGGAAIGYFLMQGAGYAGLEGPDAGSSVLEGASATRVV
jgi:MFS family permease